MVDRHVRRRFRDGDPDAVREVYRAYGRLVYAVAYKVLGDRGLAEEATQQTFLKAWRAAQSFDEDRELGPWLAAIARRVAIDVYRREALRVADPIDTARRARSRAVVHPGVGRGRCTTSGKCAARSPSSQPTSNRSCDYSTSRA